MHALHGVLDRHAGDARETGEQRCRGVAVRIRSKRDAENKEVQQKKTLTTSKIGKAGKPAARNAAPPNDHVIYIMGCSRRR